jgi:hypothetical protein
MSLTEAAAAYPDGPNRRPAGVAAPTPGRDATTERSDDCMAAKMCTTNPYLSEFEEHFFTTRDGVRLRYLKRARVCRWS